MEESGGHHSLAAAPLSAPQWYRAHFSRIITEKEKGGWTTQPCCSPNTPLAPSQLPVSPRKGGPAAGLGGATPVHVAPALALVGHHVAQAVLVFPARRPLQAPAWVAEAGG